MTRTLLPAVIPDEGSLASRRSGTQAAEFRWAMAWEGLTSGSRIALRASGMTEGEAYPSSVSISSPMFLMKTWVETHSTG